MKISKPALLLEVKKELERQLGVSTAAATSAIEGATHAESRAENDKDTRGLEQSYLARGQAARVAELKRSLETLKTLTPKTFKADHPIVALALAEIELDGAPMVIFLAPLGGGLKVTVAKQEVHVITPQSPLGSALLGRTAGESVEFHSARKLSEARVVAVA